MTTTPYSAETNLSHLKKLARKGLDLYPNKSMRKQWVAKTYQLMSEGKHRLCPEKYVQRQGVH
jgi:hypothetical protein